jgi:hypothetical protein
LHQLGNVAGDGQPQSSPHLPFIGFEPDKFVKNSRLVDHRNSAPLITDAHHQPSPVLSQGHRDLAGGEYLPAFSIILNTPCSKKDGKPRMKCACTASARSVDVVTQIKARNLWRSLCDHIFIALHRNMLSATEFYRIPPGHTVELGGHIEIG